MLYVTFFCILLEGMPHNFPFVLSLCSSDLFKTSVYICSLDFHGLKELHDEWYFKQDLERDFVKVK